MYYSIKMKMITRSKSNYKHIISHLSYSLKKMNSYSSQCKRIETYNYIVTYILQHKHTLLNKDSVYKNNLTQFIIGNNKYLYNKNIIKSLFNNELYQLLV